MSSTKQLQNYIITEGKNDVSIIKHILNRKNLQKSGYNWSCIVDVRASGGFTKTETAIKDIQEGVANNKIKIFIIVDADNDKQAKEQTINDLAKKFSDIEFNHHIITRPSKDYGIMEDLFLDIVVNLTDKSADDFYQKNTIMQLVSDVRNDVDEDTEKKHYSNKIKAATTSFVRFYNCYTDVDKNDITTLMEQDDGIAKKLMEYDTIKQMLEKIKQHFNLEQASN
jgi:hypothetical protein